MTALAVAATIVIAPFGSPYADEWKPDKLTVVVPHGVGSGQDRITRSLGEVWSKYLGVPLIYQNEKGASGRKGYEVFRGQPADGSSVLSSNLASASIMYIQQKPDWKWEDVVYPAGAFGIDPGAFYVKADSSFKTLNDMIEAAKAKPMTLGISFWASPDNLLVQQVMELTGAKFQVVPIGEGPEVITSVLAGHVGVGYAKVMNILQSGNAMRILAISMPKNDVPQLTNNAPTVSAVLKKPTLSVASYRTIFLQPAVVKKYPDRAAWLMKTFEQAKHDPAFIAEAKKLDQDPALITDMSPEELTEVVHGFWDAFSKYKEVFAKQQSVDRTDRGGWLAGWIGSASPGRQPA